MVTEDLPISQCKPVLSTEKDCPRCLGDLFSRCVDRDPHASYFIYKGQECSYIDANSMIENLAITLFNEGFRKGDRIALMLGNTPEFFIASQACFMLGLVIVPCNQRSVISEILEHLLTTGASAVITSEKNIKKFCDIGDDLQGSNLKVILCHGRDRCQRDFCKLTFLKSMDFEEACQTPSGSSGQDEQDVKDKFTWPVVNPGDAAVLQYTGGTTGYPKAAILTHENILFGSSVVRDKIHETLGEDKVRLLVAQPMYHVMGFISNFIPALFDAGVCAISPSTNSETILNVIQECKVNCLTGVPSLLYKIVNSSHLKVSSLNSLKVLMYGGSPIDHSLLKKVQSVCHANIVQGYGMSEATIIAYEYQDFNFHESDLKSCDCHEHNVLKLVRGIQARIKLDNGKLSHLKSGIRGELVVAGPQIAKSYYKNDKESALAFIDGWLHTGDVVHCCGDNLISIVGREKEMYICSGFNVFPAEIDSLLSSLEGVEECCTFGVSHKQKMEAGVTIVVLKEGFNMSQQDVKDFCRSHLNAYMIPVEILFVPEIPRTAVGKISRQMLSQLYLQNKFS